MQMRGRQIRSNALNKRIGTFAARSSQVSVVSFGAAAECGVQGEVVVFEEEEKEKEDETVEKLLAGEVPLLVGGDADGEGHHEYGSCDERGASEDTKDESYSEDGFDEGNGVAEGVDEAWWEWGFGEMFGGGLREDGDSVVDADEAVAGEIYAESCAEE